MDPNENVRERISLCELPAITLADRARYRELSEAYSEWRASGGFSADAELLERLKRLVG